MPEYEDSLGDQNTFDGGKNRSELASRSLGDEATYTGGEFGDIDDGFTDDMEVVDLESRYTTEGVLGKGGMGEVLLASDTRLNRKVAIKRILGNAARSKTAVRRFLTEGQSIAALNHPNIVQVYDYGQAKDGPFLIMEFVEGSSLLDKCASGPLALQDAIELTCQLCDGLAKAHAANIIHRDIKPANVLLTEDGIPKLTDFGLAKDESADSEMTMAGSVLGTLDFMPPEQRKDVTLTDQRSDLWSLAATLYQMVTGESPRVIDLDEVPRELRKCIAQALKNKKQDRYQTAGELRDALRSCLTTTQPPENAAVDLGAGECPDCHARNDANRKFCNGCGGSLRMTCLACEAEIPVWEKFCGECGANQHALLEQKTAEYEVEQKQGESLCRECRFTESEAIVNKFSSLSDKRFSAFREWGSTFGQELKASRQRAREQTKRCHKDAKLHRKAYDYTAAIHAMEQIPSELRTESINTYSATLISERDESQRLLDSIKESIAKRNLDDLLPQVERAIELRGNRKDLPTLKKQLLKREKQRKEQKQKQSWKISGVFNQAEEFVDAGNARHAHKILSRLDERLLSDEQLITKQKVGAIKTAEEQLVKVVQEANADGVVEPNEVWDILSAVNRVFCTTDSHTPHPIADKLLKELASRIESNPSKHIQEIVNCNRADDYTKLLQDHVSHRVQTLLKNRTEELRQNKANEALTARKRFSQGTGASGKNAKRRGSNKSRTSSVSDTGQNWFTCPHCGSRMKAKNKAKHLRRCGKVAGIDY